MERIFTPRMSIESDKRYAMHLSDEDWSKIRRGHWRATVTDTSNGRRYKVRGAPCSLSGCYCDAIVVAELRGDEDNEEA